MKSLYSLLVCSISYSDLKLSPFGIGSKLFVKLCTHTRLTLFSTSTDMRTIFKLNGFHLFGIRLNIVRERVRVGCVKAWLLYACQSLSSPWSQICCHPFLPAFLLLYMQNEKERERNTVQWNDEVKGVRGRKGKVSGGICIWGRMRSRELLLIQKAVTWFMGFLGDLEPQRQTGLVCVGEKGFTCEFQSSRDADIDLRIPSKMRLALDCQVVFQKSFWFHAWCRKESETVSSIIQSTML